MKKIIATVISILILLFSMTACPPQPPENCNCDETCTGNCVCNNCNCEPNDEICPDCETDPCSCPTPQVCPDCGTTPCSCVAVCPDCGTAPCSCVTIPACTTCGTTPCTCQTQEIEPLTDIEFARNYSGWDLQNAKNNTTVYISLLAEQSREMQDRYATWAEGLTPGSAEHNFAQFVRTAQTNIQSAYEGTNLTTLKTNVSEHIYSIFNEVRLNFIPAQDSILFIDKYIAFLYAIELAQRSRMPDNEKHQNTLLVADICNYIMEEMNDSTLFPDMMDYNQYAQILRGLLEDALPENLGPYRNDIWQQIEDYIQFDGFTKDMVSLGMSTTISSANVNQFKLGTFMATLPKQEVAPATTRSEEQEKAGLCV